MPNYQNGKIYAIRSHQKTDIYIGSTTQSLSVRFGGHKASYNQWKKGKSRYYSSFEILKCDDCYIEEIEKYPCNDKDELNRREGQLIRQMDCVNKCIAGRTRKEYLQDNKEHIKEQTRQYRQEHKEHIKIKKKEYRQEHKEHIKEQLSKWYEKNKEKVSREGKEKITCECGSIVRKAGMRRHERSNKHKKYIDSI
jgi:hypothetical protein